MKQLILGDCSEILKTFEPNSIDALITDPPAGIKFMNKSWDDDRGGRDHWIEWMTKIMKECHRVMKPGAHGLVWAIPRTSHWTATALENAGFEVRDIIHHIFGQGFPKSLDISKAIDKAAGAEREVLGKSPYANRNRSWGNVYGAPTASNIEVITKPATDGAKQWSGWGTALKPAVENWILIRKPITEKTVAQNVLTHGCGGINIDTCRIGTELRVNPPFGIKGWREKEGRTDRYEAKETSVTGRFPANLVFSHEPECEENCVDGCAVKMLDEQSLAGGMHSAGKARQARRTVESREMFSFPGDGHRIGDSGGASRFFYCAKVSQKEREEGNKHPTVKAQKLMKYLCKLITPPNGIVLDPFMGSGSTGMAALAEAFQFIGIEKEQEYFEIAEKRIQ